MSISKLGDYLVNKGILSEDDRETIIRECGRKSQAFAKSVVALGIVNQHELATLLLEQRGSLAVSADELSTPEAEAIAKIDIPLLNHLEVLPFKFDGGTLYVAMADPLDIDTIEQLKFITNCEIKPMITTFGELQDAIRGIINDFNLSDSPLQRFIEKYARPVEGAVKDSPQGSVKDSSSYAIQFEDGDDFDHDMHIETEGDGAQEIGSLEDMPSTDLGDGAEDDFEEFAMSGDHSELEVSFEMTDSNTEDDTEADQLEDNLEKRMADAESDSERYRLNSANFIRHNRRT